MNVSLIIPTYRREQLLVDTLACALRQDLGDFEILVVDQTPQHTPEVETFLRDNAARVTRVTLAPPSLTRARNVGIRQARGDLLVFIDDDTTFAPDFLRQHLAAHEAGASLVQGRVLEHNARVADKPIWISRRLRYSGSNTCATEGPINTITGCNFSVRRDVIDTIGGFDERFTGLATREDSEFGLRAYRAGIKMAFAPGALVFHHRSSTGGVADQVNNQFFDRSYYRCELLFARRHFSPLVVAVYRFRLLLRGFRQLRKLIAGAERDVGSALSKGPPNATPTTPEPPS